MAITIIKEPTGIYPGYNKSYLEFSSSLANNNRAKVIFNYTDPDQVDFVIYPDLQGVYVFNLQAITKQYFNQNGFTDKNGFTNAYSSNISGINSTQFVRLEVYSDVDNENTSKSYTFFKAVKQTGQKLFDNDYELLSYSGDGINYALTYWEGFPLFFDLKKVEALKTLKIKSLNTGIVFDGIETVGSSAFRINVDKGDGNNWTSDNKLPLITGLNRLELYEGDNFKCNILITKHKKCSGVYLRWLNNNGSYSNHLFRQYFTENTEAKEIGTVQNSDFQNIGSVTGEFISLGKIGAGGLVVKSKYNHEEYNLLKELLNSPSIEMYSSTFANIGGDFLEVKVEGALNFSNKRNLNEAIINVRLRNVNTITY